MIIQNAVKVIDKKKNIYIKSAYTHDFVTYNFSNGKSIHLDGGYSYFKRGGNLELFEDTSKIICYSLVESSTIADVLEKLLWGTRGKDEEQPLTYKPIKDLELEHLKAILEYNFEIFEMSPLHIFVINYWIKEKTEGARKQLDKDFLKKR